MTNREPWRVSTKNGIDSDSVWERRTLSTAPTLESASEHAASVDGGMVRWCSDCTAPDFLDRVNPP